MPRLVLNLAYLSPGATGGMETVARSFLPALLRALPPDWSATALVGTAAAADRDAPWSQMDHRVLSMDALQRGRWMLAEQWEVPRAARREGGDLLHSLGNNGPLRARMPHVATVNDLTLHVVEGDRADLKTRVLRGSVAWTARRADRVVSPSSQTALDLERLLGVGQDRTTVIPYGIDAQRVTPTGEQDVRARFGLGSRRLVLSPSSRLPHKNLARLLEAHAGVPGDRPLLVMPGYPTPHDGGLAQLARDLGVSDDVTWPGWVEQADLEALYRASELLVFPSLYEGFGLPVLEAMARGLPVACSGRGSLSEIAGDAALLFDPEDVSDITAAIARLASDRALRDQLRQRGLARADTYTWARCADRHVALYEEVLASSRRR